MNSTLLDLSTKVEKSVVDAIAAVSRAAERHQIPFMIVGAAARDFLLEYACGVSTGRATRDVDCAVRVHSWEEYEQLAEALEQAEGFVRNKKIRHRFKSPDSLLIDLVPFGPIAGRTQQITWPEDDERQMSVEGFESAMTDSVEVILRADPRLEVRIASLPGLALLKLVSWDDTYPDRGKDAIDFYIILNSYMETPNIERLSTDAHDLVEDPIPPLHEIGARMLGQDMASISDPSTTARVAEILSRERDGVAGLRLVEGMMSAAGASTTPDDLLALVRAFERGFSEITREQ